MRVCILAHLSMALALCSCVKKPSQEPIHLKITMRKFEIEPNVIRVNQGQKVALDVSSKDVEHGFEVEDMGINEPIQPGKPAEIALDTSKKGEFRVACSIICGPGHKDMIAKIVVQ